MLNKGMYKGIYFDDIHSFYDLNLILAPFVPVPATAKTNYIEITGGDGSLDLSEALGEIKYKARDFTFTFTINPLDAMTFDEKVSQVSNALNGKRCKITLDRDPDYYWEGRCTVDKYAQDKNLKQISVKATVKPYKLKQNETVVYAPLCGKNLISYPYAGTFGASKGLTYTDNGDGTISVKGTVTDSFSSFLLHNKFLLADGVTYRLGNSTKLLLAYRDEKGSMIYVKNSSFTWSKKYTFVQLYLQYSKGEVIDEKVEPMLIVGDTATEYEAFTPITPQEVTLSNSRKTVSPIITCSENATITFNENEYTLNTGTHKILDIQLHEGEYPITVDGSGFVIFEYQEGKL